jgi:hypothetical protein
MLDLPPPAPFFAIAQAAPAVEAPAASEAPAGGRQRRHKRHKSRHALRFVVVHGEVARILPEDTRGLRHQNFVLRVEDLKGVSQLEVNHDVSVGARVPDLKLGEPLTIRGVLYHDRRKDGIHWTHHRDKPGDAGWIQTPDGKKYE